MPSDLIPRIAAGFMLATTTTSAPIIFSRGMNFTSPLTTVRVWPSPRSICSTYRASASGCFLHSVIFPTRTSRREKSTSRSTAGALLHFTPAAALAAFSAFLSAASKGLPFLSSSLPSLPVFALPLSPAAGADFVFAAAFVASEAWLPEKRARISSISSSGMVLKIGAEAPSLWPAGRRRCGAATRATNSSVRQESPGWPSWASSFSETEGMYGSSSTASSFTRPMQHARMVAHFALSVLSTTHGCCSWKKRFPALDTFMATRRPSLILSFSSISTYSTTMGWILAPSSTPMESCSELSWGTTPSRRDAANDRVRWLKLPRLFRSSLLFLAARSVQRNLVSADSGRFTSK
mmetsp:Transcript_35423/g.67797  ORF Transcript_35423/g.67797 Transcript_35423/m.67797 type:complete len:350 (+) Transcript_35423:600-1649(+)